MAQFKVKIEDYDAPDVRAFYDSEVLRVWHLQGKPRTYRITAVKRITTEFMGEEKRKALLLLEDSKRRPVPLPLVLNATNRNTLIGLYGKAPKAWVGKLLTIYPTVTDSPRGRVDCIRIRNEVPGAGGVHTNKQGVHVLPSKAEQQPAPTHEDEDEDEASEAAEAATEATGLELDLEDDDDDEPPPGALETDKKETTDAFEIIR